MRRTSQNRRIANRAQVFDVPDAIIVTGTYSECAGRNRGDDKGGGEMHCNNVVAVKFLLEDVELSLISNDLRTERSSSY